MSKLPVWARKPNHKKEVVATSRGWMVKETGEMLKLVKNLDERLKELHEESVESLSSIEEVEPEPTVEEEENVQQAGYESDVEASEEVSEDEPAETKPKRRGRPRKSDKI